jgi:hypothetical protein
LTGKGDEMLNEESMETIKPVPQRRIVDKMNEYMSRRDYAGAERHLLYWLAEAELGRDLQGQLMLRNEMVGHYRKTAQREKAMESAGKALELLRELGMEESQYDFYLDLRKYGTVRHAGFGLGFERAVMYITGMENIRDVLPFPRTVGTCEL